MCSSNKHKVQHQGHIGTWSFTIMTPSSFHQEHQNAWSYALSLLEQLSLSLSLRVDPLDDLYSHQTGSELRLPLQVAVLWKRTTIAAHSSTNTGTNFRFFNIGITLVFFVIRKVRAVELLLSIPSSKIPIGTLLTFFCILTELDYFLQ